MKGTFYCLCLYLKFTGLDVGSGEGDPGAVLLLLDGDGELHLLLDRVEVGRRARSNQVVGHLFNLKMIIKIKIFFLCRLVRLHTGSRVGHLFGQPLPKKSDPNPDP